MSQNPYEPPREAPRPGDAGLASAGTNSAPPYELYSPKQAALAAFLGAPIAACWFMSRNYRNLGNGSAANQCLAWGLIGTVVIMGLAFVVPDWVPNQLIPISYTFGLYYAAKQLQGDAVDRHISAGGRLGSSWRVAGISLLWLIAILAIIFAIAFLTVPDQ